MSRPTPYASFANYNSNNKDSGSIYRKMGNVEEPIKPLNGGIRPQDKNPPQPQVQPDPKVQNESYDQNVNDRQRPHRVREISSEKLYELLTTPMYHFTPQETPLKILVKVYTDWCKPCQQVAPAIEELSVSPEFSDILFVQLNGEQICEKLATIVKVSAVPVFLGFVAGKNIDFIPGPDVGKVIDLCKRMNGLNVIKK